MQTHRTPPAATRRGDILAVVADEQCEHTANIAYDLNWPLSTVRRDLDWLETQGFVTGIKHDERDTLHAGRIRIYWSITDKGREVLKETDG